MNRRYSFFVCAFTGMLVPAAALAHGVDAGSALPERSAYLGLGFTHILSGLDHLAFVAGLVLMQSSLRQLVWAVTAFSLAHCVTLALAAMQLIAPDARWVEPAIALSIAYVGAENLWLRPAGARVRLALVFGLLHGCGFGGALLELGMPGGADAAWALGLFSLGVEAGQLAVVGVLYALVHALSRRERWGRWLVPAVNVGLVATGVAWAGERIVTGTGTSASASASTGEREGVLQPVFPARVAVSDGRVSAFCEVVQELPRRRRAECAGRAPGIAFSRECERSLGAAVESGAVRLDEAAVEQCLQGMAQRYRGCEWVRDGYRAPLQDCVRALAGTLAAGQSCRSSLECTDGLHCNGVGPLDRGVCTPPKAAGQRCQLAVDPLAAYVPNAAEQRHPECAGRCVQNRCLQERAADARPARAAGRDLSERYSWTPSTKPGHRLSSRSSFWSRLSVKP